MTSHAPSITSNPNIVAIGLNANGEYHEAYIQLYAAVLQQRFAAVQKCTEIIEDATQPPAQQVYALAGLKLADIRQAEFNRLLLLVAGRTGRFQFSGWSAGDHTVSLTGVPALFEGPRTRLMFPAPPGLAPIPDLPADPQHVPPPRHGRAQRPVCRTPLCAHCSKPLEAPLLHADTACSVCRIPVSMCVPLWQCVTCDEHTAMCHNCTLKAFAPSILHGAPPALGGYGVPHHGGTYGFPPYSPHRHHLLHLNHHHHPPPPPPHHHHHHHHNSHTSRGGRGGGGRGGGGHLAGSLAHDPHLMMG